MITHYLKYRSVTLKYFKMYSKDLRTIKFLCILCSDSPVINILPQVCKNNTHLLLNILVCVPLTQRQDLLHNHNTTIKIKKVGLGCSFIVEYLTTCMYKIILGSISSTTKEIKKNKIRKMDINTIHVWYIFRFCPCVAP